MKIIGLVGRPEINSMVGMVVRAMQMDTTRSSLIVDPLQFQWLLRSLSMYDQPIEDRDC